VQNSGSIDLHHHRIPGLVGSFDSLFSAGSIFVSGRRNAIGVENFNRLFPDNSSAAVFEGVFEDFPDFV
jgi:hypothetical protein